MPRQQRFAKKYGRTPPRVDTFTTAELEAEARNSRCRRNGCLRSVKYPGYCSKECLDRSVPLREHANA